MDLANREILRNWRDVAEYLGLTYNYVLEEFKKMGSPRPPCMKAEIRKWRAGRIRTTNPNPARRLQVAAMKREGMTNREIARELGCSQYAVYSISKWLRGWRENPKHKRPPRWYKPEV